MAQQPSGNFFALVRHDPDPVRRIRLTHDVQDALSALFMEQAGKLVHPDFERVPFDGHYRPDDSEILSISPFQMPETIWAALREPAACEDLVFGTEAAPNIRAIFTGSFEKKWVAFQAFQRSQLLTRRGISIILSRNTYRRLEEPGLNIEEQVDVFFENDALLFRSFHRAKMILDLSQYYREATDQDLESFGKLPAVYFKDPQTLRVHADTWVRRKVALIQDRGVLTTSDPKVIVAAAREYGLGLSLHNKNGTDALVFPSDKKELKSLLKFLDEDYYTGPVSGSRYISNSKRQL